MIPGSANPLLLASAAAGGYQIQRSLRFNSSDSGFCSRTPAVAGSRTTWTWAGWVKRSELAVGGQAHSLFAAGGPGNDAGFYFTGGDTIEIYYYAGAYQYRKATTQVFRDTSAWYHLVQTFDTNNATPDDRVRLYVNGIRVTTFAASINPGLGYSSGLINSVTQHTISSLNNIARWLGGYLADIHFIDGQALTPSSFTEVSATTGQLIPKAYSGSFGTNGFWLKFSDNSNNTAATLGKDYSGNSNNWTPNNLSVTAGAGNDSLVDTPTSFGTDTGVGNEVRGNYATLNPLNNPGGSTLSNGNLDCVTSSSLNGRVVSTIAVTSGKWYWEMLATNIATDLMVGISAASEATATTIPTSATTYLYDSFYGDKWNNGSHSAYGATYTTNDVIGVALNLDAGTLVFYKNGTSQGTAFSSLSGTFVAAFADGGTGTSSFTANFGQRAFAYTAPSGFKALCDTNLPAPLTAKPNTVMDVITYTGTGSSLTLPNGSSTPTSISFTPDFAWLKGRSGATDHALYDAVRGVQKDLVSNSTSAETTETTGLTAFGTNTFTVGSLAKLNTSSSTYVAWAWNAGGTTDPSNTAGSITSQVRANVSAGFSVITTNGATGPGTVGHGLNVAPSFIIGKDRDTGGTNWVVYHKALGATKFLVFDSSSAITDSGVWGGTEPTSSVFTVGNYISGSFVWYCFAPVVGYSSFGSASLNASADGAFIYLGFRPKFFMIKGSDNTSNWIIFDSQRDPFNFVDQELFANLSNAEGTPGSTYSFDFLSNGVKARNQGLTGSFIYMAFAESPLQYARAR